HDAQKRKDGIDRNKAFLPPRAQIAQRNDPFEWSKRIGAARLGHRIFPAIHCRMILAVSRLHLRPGRGQSRVPPNESYAVSRPTASFRPTSSRLSSARFLISTLPPAKPFAPTTTCPGIPIRSPPANLPPAP